MKWRHGSAGCAQLGLALSDGSVGILTPSLEEKCLGPMHSLMIEAGSLATCVDFSAQDESTLAVSVASGQLGLVQVCCCGCRNCSKLQRSVFPQACRCPSLQVTESALVMTHKFWAHDSEIWSCAFSPLEVVLCFHPDTTHRDLEGSLSRPI